MTPEFQCRISDYEGPLDVLLMLISKHKLDILNIEISVLTEQFLLFLNTVEAGGQSVTSDFIEMAARLILIKTIAMLPKHEETEESEELRKLTGQLIEYSLCKKVARYLAEIFNGNKLFCRPPEEGSKIYTGKRDAYELAQILAVLRKNFSEKPKPITDPNSIVERIEYVSVFSKVIFVLRKLKSFGVYPVKELYRGLNRSSCVAVFLSLLELNKAGRIVFTDNDQYIEMADPNIKEETKTAANDVEEDKEREENAI